MNPDIHVGDIGTAMVFQVVDQSNNIVDLSSASAMQVILKAPSWSSGQAFTAVWSTNGTDGKMQYVSIASTFSEPGTWQAQVYFAIGGGAWKSDIVKFKVKANL